MSQFAISHLPSHVLLRNLKELVSRDRSTTAELLAHIAVVEDRRLYAAEGYESAFEYCVRVLRMSEDVAWKRIRVARAARRFPLILSAIAEGRLHVSGVFLLARWLKRPEGPALLAAAEGRTKSEIEALIAERFPQPDVPTMLMPLVTSATAAVRLDPACGGATASNPAGSPAPAQASDAMDSLLTGVRSPAPEDSPADASPAGVTDEPRAPGGVDEAGGATRPDSPGSPAPGQAEFAAPRARLTPLSARGVAFQCTFRPETVELLRYAQALLAHAIPSGDLADVLDRCVREAVDRIEKRRFAPNARENFRARRTPDNPRYIPARVRSEVWVRDGGQCTFTSDRGHRCGATSMLQFHHVVSVARGGQPTAEGLSLRCRAHNLYEAERELGAGYMREKIEASRARTEAARAAKVARTGESARKDAAPRAWGEASRAQDEESQVRAGSAPTEPAACTAAAARKAGVSLAPPPSPDASREARACVTRESPAPGRVVPSSFAFGSPRKEPVRAEALRE